MNCENIHEDIHERIHESERKLDEGILKGKKVRFNDKVKFRPVPPEGRGRKTPERGRSSDEFRGRKTAGASGSSVGSVDTIDRRNPTSSPEHGKETTILQPKEKWADMEDEPSAASHALTATSAEVEESRMPEGIGIGPITNVFKSGTSPTGFSDGQEKSGRDTGRSVQPHRCATPDWRPVHRHLEESDAVIPTGEIASVGIRSRSYRGDHRMHRGDGFSSRISRRRSVGGGTHSHARCTRSDVSHAHVHMYDRYEYSVARALACCVPIDMNRNAIHRIVGSS